MLNLDRGKGFLLILETAANNSKELSELIIAATIPLIVCVLGLVANLYYQRRSHNTRVLLISRVQRRQRIQYIAAGIMLNTDPDYLAPMDENEIKECYYVVLSLYSKLRSILGLMYEKDYELMIVSSKIKDDMRFILENQTIPDTLVGNRKCFSKLVDLYVTTEWQRIKKEVRGGGFMGKKRYDEWLEMYRDNKYIYESKEKKRRERNI